MSVKHFVAFAAFVKRRSSSARLRRTLLGFAATTAFVASATPAMAGYSVTTVANSGGGYNRGCAATYNYIGSGAKFVVNDGSNAPCAHPAASFNGQHITDDGTLDTTGKLTAAHDSSSVAADNGSYGAAASAAADLRTGKVHLYANAYGPLGGSNASARLDDTLHFTIAGATASTVTYVPVSFAFDGKLPGTTDPHTAYAELNYSFTFGGASAYEFGDYGAGYYGVYNRYPTFVYAGAPITGGWQSASFSSYNPLNTKFSGVYAITGKTADIAVDFFLGLSAGANVTLDYLNTGSVSIGHVDGVSYTSDSGVFLTGDGTVGGVPEPASWALLVAGFGVVGTAARRRREGVVAA